MTLDELRISKRNAILATAAKHGVTSLRVFGSFARGDARPDSDLDLLIERGPHRTPFFREGYLRISKKFSGGAWTWLPNLRCRT